MKCPNCGAEMPVESLYCEQCGKDIHIVPDFEPEVELNIEQSISGIAEDIKEEQDIKEERDITDWDREDEKLSLNSRGISGTAVFTVLTILICLIIVVVGVFFYRYNSVTIQTEKAKKYLEQGQYDNAITYYQHVLKLTDNDISVRFKLAEVYFLKNDKVEYECLLREIVNDSHATKEQMENAYGKLIAIYRAKEGFESINELLLACNNREAIEAYQDYMAIPPEFSIQEGFYTSIQPLKLTAYGSGNIYYTLDGSIPNEDSEQYITPIILDEGQHTVRAFFVNEYGIASEVVTKTYQIEIDELSKPVVGTVSGEYSIPTLIEILENNDEVYYTADGSTPTLQSTLYTGPIHMPLGKSVYKFIRIEGGRKSEVVERTYNLVLNTAYTVEDAVNRVVDYFIESGKIFGKDGGVYNSTDKYKYQFQYVVNINDEGHYYVISEILQSEDGTQTKTGNHFALDAYNGRFFKLLVDEDNNYTLVEIEEQS